MRDGHAFCGQKGDLRKAVAVGLRGANKAIIGNDAVPWRACRAKNGFADGELLDQVNGHAGRRRQITGRRHAAWPDAVEKVEDCPG